MLTHTMSCGKWMGESYCRDSREFLIRYATYVNLPQLRAWRKYSQLGICAVLGMREPESALLGLLGQIQKGPLGVKGGQSRSGGYPSTSPLAISIESRGRLRRCELSRHTL